MNPTLDAALRSWPAEPWLLLALAVGAAIYTRGWLLLRRGAERSVASTLRVPSAPCGAHHASKRDGTRSVPATFASRWTLVRLAAFYGGLIAIYLALASPIEPFASLLLAVHMVQHVLLMMVAPPLIWLGSPLVPLLRGLPEPVRAVWIAPLMRNRSLRRIFNAMAQPVAALVLFVAATWAWHWPPAYELGLRSQSWHYVEHACFFGTGLLFWLPVVGPYPSRARRSNWILVPYLFLADVQNTVLSALITFSGTLLYPYYAEVPRLGGLSAIADQKAAGVIMWVPGSIAFLLPMFSLGVKLLYGDGAARKYPWAAKQRKIASPSAGHDGLDLLQQPLLGRLLKWRHSRMLAQTPLFLLAGLMIFDGLRGPQIAPMNLAGVLPWIHWRGLLILSLLVGGNFFCMACPFTLPRTLARRWLPATHDWPRWLRSKWLAVALVGLFLWAYEAFALWDSPRWTAWIAVGYFLAAFAVDSIFRGAAFCKYVCPIGQFNFVQSLVSPLEIKVREPATCASCATKDCIRGGSGVPGCELHLFQPRKASNMDCTFCLDCVHACPHDNVGILIAPPGKSLWSDRPRSGVGRFSRRTDLAALVLVLVFGAFANAAGMVEPVVAWEQALQARLGWSSPLAIISGFYIAALLLLPIVLVAIATSVSRQCGSRDERWIRTATRFSFALVPIGFSMWLAHYSFHFFNSYDTAIPAAQRFAADLGLSMFGLPQWSCSCCRPGADWLPRLEISCLDVGLLLSLYTAFRIARHAPANVRSVPVSRSLRIALPWAILIVLLFAAGMWVVLQPMQMRGMLPGGTG